MERTRLILFLALQATVIHRYLLKLYCAWRDPQAQYWTCAEIGPPEGTQNLLTLKAALSSVEKHTRTWHACVVSSLVSSYTWGTRGTNAVWQSGHACSLCVFKTGDFSQASCVKVCKISAVCSKLQLLCIQWRTGSRNQSWCVTEP